MRDFSELVFQYQDRVYAFALHYLGDGAEAADVTQEVLIRLWENLNRLDEERLLPWLMHVTRNLCVDAYRKRRLERHVTDPEFGHVLEEEVPDNDPAPDAAAETAEFNGLVLRALRSLPEPYRSIIMLREINDLKYDEISSALELPLNTVKVYLHRARRMAREWLSNHLIHEYHSF